MTIKATHTATCLPIPAYHIQRVADLPTAECQHAVLVRVDNYVRTVHATPTPGLNRVPFLACNTRSQPADLLALPEAHTVTCPKYTFVYFSHITRSQIAALLAFFEAHTVTRLFFARNIQPITKVNGMLEERMTAAADKLTAAGGDFLKAAAQEVNTTSFCCANFIYLGVFFFFLSSLKVYLLVLIRLLGEITTAPTFRGPKFLFEYSWSTSIVARVSEKWRVNSTLKHVWQLALASSWAALSTNMACCCTGGKRHLLFAALILLVERFVLVSCTTSSETLFTSCTGGE